jgi:hypothetical protein
MSDMDHDKIPRAYTRFRGEILPHQDESLAIFVTKPSLDRDAFHSV